MDASKKAMNEKEYALANDYNTESAFLNSVLQKLARLDIQLKGLQEIFGECKANTTNTDSQKQEAEVVINNEIDMIRKELYTKLNSMLDQLKSHQTMQQGDALKLQQEISTLKKEKLDLYQKINELQKRIQDMEMTIGQDPGAFITK